MSVSATRPAGLYGESLWSEKRRTPRP